MRAVRKTSLIIAAITLISTMTVLALGAVSAQATIPIGPGYQIPNPYRDSIIGGYRAPDGNILYCLEWGKESPTGPNDTFDSIESTNSYAGWSHLEIARVNYLISKWGQTNDNNQAAAVQMAIWMRHPGAGDPFFAEHRFVKATIRDAAVRAAITQRAQTMNAEADTFTPYARAAIGQITLTPAENDPLTGVLRVTGIPANTTGTLQLNGALFELNQASSMAGVRNGDEFRYHGALRDDEFGQHRVGVTSNFITPGSPGDEVIIWKNSDSFQDLGEHSSYIPDFEYSLSAEIVVPVTFAPTLTTVAAESVSALGDGLADTIEVDLAEASKPWRQLSDGSYLAVDAWCQAYGPLKERPQTRGQVPADAPKFGEQVLVQIGGGLADPLKTVYRAEFAEKPKNAGFYTFVCGFSGAVQSATEASASLPAGYSFQHEFGLPEETTSITAPLAETGTANSAAWTFAVATVMLCLGLSVLGARAVEKRLRG